MKALMATLAGILCLLSNSDSTAQKLLWSQDFNNYSQVNFSYPWSISGSGAAPWICDVPYNILGLGYVGFYGGNKVAGVSSTSQTDVLLMTPPISLTAAQSPYMSFESYFQRTQSNGKTEQASVEVSTDNGLSWTVVGHPPVCNGRYMQQSFVSLAAYSNAPSIRLGFRYSDSGQLMLGWLINNIRVFAPATNDIALVRTYPEDSFVSYFVAPGSVPVSGTVMNTGASVIDSFTVNYSENGSASQTFTITGLNLQPLDTFDFTHNVPYPLNSIGPHKIKMWASLAADTSHKNDTLSTVIHGAKFIPDKRLTIEEGTGTWSIYSPRGHVYMHNLDNADPTPTRIQVHSGDPMEDKAYSDYLYYLNQNFVPYFLFDRRGPVGYYEFFAKYAQQKSYFGFANIDVSGRAAGQHLSVDVNVRPAVDMNGSYSLALVVTENGVTGFGSGYGQANIYAGGALGPMGGYENLSNPVPAASMTYDFVARSISPAPDGNGTCLPTLMQAGKSYSCNLQTNYDASWKYANLNVVVLLISNKDSSILNSKQVSFHSLDVAPAETLSNTLHVFPNPSGSLATLEFGIAARSTTTVIATDITGRTLYQTPASLMDAGLHHVGIDVRAWPSGMYFITLQSGDYKETIKLSVAH